MGKHLFLTKEKVKEMARNLRKKYDCSVKFDIALWMYKFDNTPEKAESLQYGIYVSCFESGTVFFDTQEELVRYYEKLMASKEDE